MKADLDNYTLACTETFTEEEKKQYKEAIDKLYELGIDIYLFDDPFWMMCHPDGINTFKADEQRAIDLLLNKHEEIPDDLRTRLVYYKKIRKQQEAENE